MFFVRGVIDLDDTDDVDHSFISFIRFAWPYTFEKLFHHQLFGRTGCLLKPLPSTVRIILQVSSRGMILPFEPVANYWNGTYSRAFNTTALTFPSGDALSIKSGTSSKAQSFVPSTYHSIIPNLPNRFLSWPKLFRLIHHDTTNNFGQPVTRPSHLSTYVWLPVPPRWRMVSRIRLKWRKCINFNKFYLRQRCNCRLSSSGWCAGESTVCNINVSVFSDSQFRQPAENKQSSEFYSNQQLPLWHWREILELLWK